MGGDVTLVAVAFDGWPSDSKLKLSIDDMPSLFCEDGLGSCFREQPGRSVGSRKEVCMIHGWF